MGVDAHRRAGRLVDCRTDERMAKIHFRAVTSISIADTAGVSASSPTFSPSNTSPASKTSLSDRLSFSAIIRSNARVAGGRSAARPKKVRSSRSVSGSQCDSAESDRRSPRGSSTSAGIAIGLVQKARRSSTADRAPRGQSDAPRQQRQASPAVMRDIRMRQFGFRVAAEPHQQNDWIRAEPARDERKHVAARWVQPLDIVRYEKDGLARRTAVSSVSAARPTRKISGAAASALIPKAESNADRWRGGSVSICLRTGLKAC